MRKGIAALVLLVVSLSLPVLAGEPQDCVTCHYRGMASVELNRSSQPARAVVCTRGRFETDGHGLPMILKQWFSDRAR